MLDQPVHFHMYPQPSSGYVYYATLPCASLITLPQNPELEVSYKQLVCTEQDRALISEIITNIAENGKISLLLKHNYLRNLGARINHVHPIKFLAVVFSTPYLKSCMGDIFDDYFKRNGFMDGLGPSLTREAEKGKLEKYLVEFAAEVNVTADSIRPYFQSRDWDGLVQHLIKS